MTAKEQERKALAQIKKIVGELGADSYLAAAFDGCFEIAESNIENDWACSMKQRAESAEKKITTLELDNRDLRLAVSEVKEEASRKETALNEKITELAAKILDDDDLCDCKMLLEDVLCSLGKEVDAAASRIVEMADNAGSSEFASTVREHRALRDKYNYYLELNARLMRAMRAGA